MKRQREIFSDVHRKRKATRKPRIHGEYNAESYTVFVDSEPVYTAGNYLDAAAGVGVRTMRVYCETSARDIAEERGGSFDGVYPADE